MNYEVIENLSNDNIIELYDDIVTGVSENNEFISAARTCACITRRHYSSSTCYAQGSTYYFECTWYAGSNRDFNYCDTSCQSYCNSPGIDWHFNSSSPYNYPICVRT